MTFSEYLESIGRSAVNAVIYIFFAFLMYLVATHIPVCEANNGFAALYNLATTFIIYGLGLGALLVGLLGILLVPFAILGISSAQATAGAAGWAMYKIAKPRS